MQIMQQKIKWERLQMNYYVMLPKNKYKTST